MVDSSYLSHTSTYLSIILLGGRMNLQFGTYLKIRIDIMEINISKFEREIAKEYLELFDTEMRQGGEDSYQFTKAIMNIAATSAAIAIKQYHEKLMQECGYNDK